MKQSYFLGSSGKNGFFSLFSRIAPKIEGQYTYIIKGGPGTGKSSMMKKIADELERRDIDCERIFCSSDPSSLDGVIFPSLRVSIADGTSPHTLEPDYPGATGEIINLADCWDKQKIFDNKEKIIALTEKNRECHRRCGRFIDSALSIYADGEKICRDCVDKERLLRYASRIANRYIKRLSAKTGIEKIRLLDAVTPEGYFFMSDTVNGMCDTTIVFEDDFGVASSMLVQELRSYALASGYTVISSPFIGNEKQLRHIIIKELALGFFTCDRLCEPDIIASKTVSLRRFYNSAELTMHRARLSFSKKATKELMNEAVCALKMAKDEHDELEKCYIEAMNFDMLNEITRKLTERIWQSEWWSE